MKKIENYDLYENESGDKNFIMMKSQNPLLMLIENF